MLADPAAIIINGVTKNLVRVNQDKYSSEYLLRETTGEYRLRVTNTSRFDKRYGRDVERHSIDLTHTLYPAVAGQPATVRKSYFVIEAQPGDTLVDPMYEAAALCGYLTASSSANITKMLNSES